MTLFLTERTEQFKKFVARKEQAAREAVIPGFTTRLDYSNQFEFTRVGNEWSVACFDGFFYYSPSREPSLPSVNTVFVQSKDRNTGTSNPAGLGGGKTDMHLIYEGLSRVAADAALAGANTLRGSGIVLSVWHPEMVNLRQSLRKPRHPTQIVATESGQLDMDCELVFNVPEVPVVVLTTRGGSELLAPSAKRRPWITVLETGQHSDLKQGLKILKRDLGINTISAIGGRMLTSVLIDEGLVQDLYLTTSPKAGGQPNTPYYVGKKEFSKRLVLRKEGRKEESGVIFEHFVIS
jgi:2,5-diamino-6-(ribosylamino)-4(3H)-pyrimidinone 5'-phosphate reductase